MGERTWLTETPPNELGSEHGGDFMGEMFEHDIEAEYECLASQELRDNRDEDISVFPNPEVDKAELPQDEAAQTEALDSQLNEETLPIPKAQPGGDVEQGRKHPETTNPSRTRVQELRKLWQGELPRGASRGCVADAADVKGSDVKSSATGLVRARVQDFSAQTRPRAGSWAGPNVAVLPAWKGTVHYDMTMDDCILKAPETSADPEVSRMYSMMKATVPTSDMTVFQEIIASTARQAVHQVLEEALPALELHMNRQIEAEAKSFWRASMGKPENSPGKAFPEELAPSSHRSQTLEASMAKSGRLHLELQEIMGRCSKLLEQGAQLLSNLAPNRLAVGSLVQVKEGGRVGELVLDDGSETPYKVQFKDGKEPVCLRYPLADIQEAQLVEAQVAKPSTTRRARGPSKLAFWSRMVSAATGAMAPVALATPTATTSVMPHEEFTPAPPSAVEATSPSWPKPRTSHSRLAVGSHVRLVTSGRRGELVVVDDSDLPYKVRFFNKVAPFSDWHRESEIEVFSDAEIFSDAEVNGEMADMGSRHLNAV